MTKFFWKQELQFPVSSQDSLFVCRAQSIYKPKIIRFFFIKIEKFYENVILIQNWIQNLFLYFNLTLIYVLILMINHDKHTARRNENRYWNPSTK